MTATMGGTGTSNGPGPTSLDGTTDGGATDTDAATTDETATTGDSATGSTSEGETEEESTGMMGACHPILVEVLYDPASGNNDEQWIKLFNPCDEGVNLVGYSLGWGGANYAESGIDLTGSVGAGECFIVGGPQSEDDNANPVLDQAEDLDSDLSQDSTPGNGVALFDMAEDAVLPETHPLDAVIYGDDNMSGLIDPMGNTPPPHVGDASSTNSIRRTSAASTWIIEVNPTPNVCPPY